MVALLLAMMAASSLRAEITADRADYTHVSWTRQDGAPTGVVALAQTKDHYLWLGSAVGLYRFDGVRFERYPFHSTEATLPARNIACLAADSSGGLWVGFETGGIAHLRDGRLSIYGRNDGFGTESTEQVEERADGSVWAIADGRLMTFDGKRWTDFGAQHGLSATSLFTFHFDLHGGMWASAHAKVWHMAAGRNVFEEYPTTTLQVHQFFDAPDGSVWIADAWRSIRPVDSKTETMPMHYSAHALFRPDGELWVAMNYPGVVQASLRPGNTLHQHHLYTDLSAAGTRAILADNQGNIFVGTNGGLDRFQRSAFSRYQGSKTEYYPSLAATPDGAVWIGGHDKPVMRYRDGHSEPSPLKHGMGPMYVARDGRVWMQDARSHTIRGALGENVIDLPSPIPQDKSAAVQAIGQDLDGALLASMDGAGLWKFSGGWKPVNIPGLPKSTVLSMLTSSDGALWLSYRDNTVVRRTSSANKVYRGRGINVNDVVLLQEAGGTLWVAGADGIAYLKDDRFHMVTLAVPERTQGTSGLLSDASGNLWLNAEAGVVKIPADELGRALHDEGFHAASELYTEHQGIVGTPAQMRPVPSAVRDKTGRMWFATIDNLVSRKDGAAVVPQSAEMPIVRGYSVDGVPSSAVGKPIRIQAQGGLRNLNFDFVAVNLGAGERVEYRYRMEGIDHDWQNAGTRRQAFYMRLPPGTFHFRVMASNGYGVWHEAANPVLVEIAPAFYQTRLFLIFATALAVMAILLLIRAASRAATAAERSRGAVELAERQRIARVLHDTLLQSVQGLILSFQAIATELPQESPAQQRIETILDRAQIVLEEGRNSVHELRGAPIDADGLLHALVEIANDGGRSKPLVTAHETGKRRLLVPQVCSDVFYIAKEAILNALAHAHAESLRIEIEYGEEQFSLSVADDGAGIPKAILHGGRNGHWGLVGIRERGKSMNALVRIESQLGAGTKVSVRMSARHSYRR